MTSSAPAARFARNGCVTIGLALAITAMTGMTSAATPASPGAPDPMSVSTASTTPAPVDSTAKPFAWNERFPRFRATEYVGTAVVGVYALLMLTTIKSHDHASWNHPILFDEPVRDALRVKDPDKLKTVRKVGDILTVFPGFYVIAVDSIVVPLARGSFDVAWQMTLMDIEAYALSGALTSTLFTVTGRARPSYDECRSGQSQDPLCNTGTFADFPSGHTASAMTAAGLSCAHHMNIPLYGGGLADTLACVSTLTMATGAGLMRLIGDRHYISDVLVGGAIGFLAGFGLPSLLHYRERPVEEVYRSETMRVAVLPGAGVTPFGASVLAVF